MKLRSTKGFSLVELIIVIAILGIIAVIAIPNLTGIQKRSQVNADIRSAETIAKSLTIAIAEERIVSHDSTNKNLRTALSTGWFKLDGNADGDLEKDITGIDFDEYVDTTLIPKSGGLSAHYYVKYVTDRIVVAVATESPTKAKTDSKPYDGTWETGYTAEFACIQGKELTVANIATYNP